MKQTLWQFHGGIHPPQYKDPANQLPIADAEIPEKLIIPLQQHIGAPATAVVNKGQTILKGELIAQANGAISANIHAPTSGTISDIGNYPVQHPSLLEGECIVITADGKDQWIELQKNDNPMILSPEVIINLIKQAGIVGLGGAGFPTAVKLHPKKDSPILTLIANGAECEPYISADDTLMQNYSPEIISGLQLIARATNAETIHIAIEDNKPRAIAAMRKAVTDHGKKGIPMQFSVIPTKYPTGGEKQLIQILTGIEILSGSVPADNGLLCQNVATAYAVYQALYHGKPLISRVTTITGSGVKSPQNYEVLLGTPVSYLLQQAQSQTSLQRLIIGGPMMGFTVTNDQVPITKTSNCLLAFTEENISADNDFKEQPCIRCGQCEQVCPMQLLPQQLYWYAKAHDFQNTQRYHLFDCIECGACSYVCPSHIPLVQYYRFAKGSIKQAEIETQKSDHARQRFEARQARLEQQAKEKELRRQAKLAKQKNKAPVKATNSISTNFAKTTKESEKLTLQLKNQYNKAQKKVQDAEQALALLTKQNDTDKDELQTYETKIKQLKSVADKSYEKWQQTLTTKQRTDTGTGSTETEQEIIAAAIKRTQKKRDPS